MTLGTLLTSEDSDELRTLVLADAAEQPIVTLAAMHLCQALNSLDLTI